MAAGAAANGDGAEGGGVTRDERIAAAEDLIRNGVGPGTTLRDALRLVEGLVVEATLDVYGKQVAAASALGCTREHLYDVRKREGLPIRPSGERPIPKFWRERLAQ
jgi:hypothetical protein